MASREQPEGVPHAWAGCHRSAGVLVIGSGGPSRPDKVTEAQRLPCRIKIRQLTPLLRRRVNKTGTGAGVVGVWNRVLRVLAVVCCLSLVTAE